MQAAMEEQASAERQRRATVTRAEGSKTAAILEAEGRLEAARRDAEAQVVLAQASQRSIEMVTSAVADKELPVMYLLGERYIEAVKQMATSQNGKIVLIPGDLQATIRGVLGKH
jgi:regulator of protease activity HflC (stomatin/prohibitin superfamily)